MTVRLLVAAFVITVGCPSAFAEQTQQWTVLFKDGTSVIHHTPQVEAKYIQGTISALQETGMSRFALKIAGKGKIQPARHQQWFAIRIENNVAEIRAMKLIPAVYITNLVEQLSDSGIRKFRFAVPAEK